MKASYLDGRKVIVNDQVYLYLFGTSYLGLPYHAEFQRHLNDGLLKYGSSLGSSPLSSPQLAVYEALESILASRYGYEDALLFPSGYAAGQTIVHFYNKQNHVVVYGNVVHPALRLSGKAEALTGNAMSRSKLLVVDFIDPITFEKYDLSKIDSEKDKVLIDVSHGLGLFDKDILSFSKSSNIVLCGSLNKALGINAGIVLCSTELKRKVQSSMRYKTASAPSPAECYALSLGLESGLIGQQQAHLQELMTKFRTRDGVSSVPDFPVLKLERCKEDLADQLKKNEILIWRNRYPSGDSPLVCRAVFTAAHKVEDVSLFLDQLDQLSV